MNTLLKRTVMLGLPLVIGAATLLGGCVAYPESYAPSYGHYYSPETPRYVYPGYYFYSEPYGSRYYGRGYEHEEHEEHERGYRRWDQDDDRRGGDRDDEHYEGRR
jgi:hypothetical protein